MTGQRSIIAAILVAIAAIALSGTLVHLLTESWWFDSVGFPDVFWTRISWQIGVWVGTFACYGLFLWANYSLAMRNTRDRSFELLERYQWGVYAKTLPKYLIGSAIVLIALGATSSYVPAWETILEYFNATEFGSQDPIFQRDIGFYVFQLPLYQTLHNWFLTLFAWGFGLAVLVYVLKGEIRPERGWRYFLTGAAKTHLCALLAAIALFIAIGYWLERYELLYSPLGVVFGAGYTDANARLHAYWIMGFVAIAVGLLFVFAIWRSGFTLPLFGIGIFAIALIVVNGVYPWFQQQFIVSPNELEKERPYIANSIEFTRNAYGLDAVETRDFPAESALSQQDLQNNQATLRNVRLWDYRPLLSTYRQIQEIRLYYRFFDLDIDRYTIDGNYRQVMLAPRELDYDQVPAEAQTWVNERLKYTHGYGLVMSPVNVVTPQGLPELFIQDIPPESQIDLEVTEPAVYYGELTDNYIFTGTTTTEFDYPQGDENAFTTYDGAGGVPMPTVWHRLAYAYELGSLKTLISNYFTAESKIHYHRQIRDRVNQVAPFLRFDQDPYITLIDGRLQWIVDAYTTSDRYPYSEPVAQSDNAASVVSGSVARVSQGGINYIRNSVKVVVDAFDGTMRFYIVDNTDPLITTYRKIFPYLFEPTDVIPADVRDHFRYPLDLFKIQAQIYLSYHMQDPDVFYNREDLWRFPTEIYEGNRQLMEPYYIIMSLPEAEGEEFILILPFTPVNKDNMIAWMAARSDGENYGKILLYEFPKQELIYGPSQIEARIDQTPEISQQLTLWSQEGSNVIRGDLLVIPIEQSLLYVEPIYLRAEQGELPELKRVIVAYGDDVVMEETLEQAIAAIFGGAPEPEPEQTRVTPDTLPDAVSGLARSALQRYQQAQEALRQGDWARYGQYQRELETILQQLNQSSPAGETPTE